MFKTTKCTRELTLSETMELLQRDCREPLGAVDAKKMAHIKGLEGFKEKKGWFYFSRFASLKPFELAQFIYVPPTLWVREKTAAAMPLLPFEIRCAQFHAKHNKNKNKIMMTKKSVTVRFVEMIL